MSDPKIVDNISIDDRTIPIYDSGIIYPNSSNISGNLTEIVTNLDIPSSRYYYLSKKGDPIPYPAVSSEEQTRRDIHAWQYLWYHNHPTIYAREIVDSSSPEIDLINITEGKRLINITEGNRLRNIRYLVSIMRNYLDELAQTSGLAPIFNFGTVIQFYRYPFNPSSEFIRASQLAYNKNLSDIQQYLDEIGVIHFSAENIINLTDYIIFFYLTRFYGPPSDKIDLSMQAYLVKYLKLAQNDTSRELVIKFSEYNRSMTFEKYKHVFEAYFNEYNQNPDANIHENLGAASKDLLLQSFNSYLLLLERPQNLPPLTLNIVRQLDLNNINDIIDYLKPYTDLEIFALTGIINARNRYALIVKAGKILQRDNVFLLTPAEASLCNNSETVATLEEFSELKHAFLGKGNLANGLDCYDIIELFQTFEANRSTDGTYIFRDPVHYEREFQIEDLKRMKAAIESNRVPPNETIINEFNRYISQAELQSDSKFKEILAFRRFADQGESNKQLIRNIFTSYFRMGMYMRQWKGPQHPYPIMKSDTGQTTGGLAPEQVSLNVSEENNIFRDYLYRLPDELKDIFWKLTVKRRYSGQIQDIGKTIRTRYQSVIEIGNYCIRAASAPWVFTGAYYLKQILNEEIVGFDLGSGLEFIA